jgi:hypothetical protein
VPNRAKPPSPNELYARIAGKRGTAFLRAVLLELLAETRARVAFAPRPRAELVIGGAHAFIGRRPRGLVLGHVSRRGGPLGRHLALVAHREAGAIEAFRGLRAELLLHGAPPSLLRAAEEASAASTRHALVFTSLARRFGGVVREPRLVRQAPPSLLEVAAQNAADGCVRQTFGALVALFQARKARDPSVARAMAELATDELRHARLAFRIDLWAAASLDEPERATVDEAKRAALERLRAEVACEPEDELVTWAGSPRSAEAVALADAFRARLFDAT